MAALNYAMESAMSAVRRGLEPLIPALRRFARALARDAEIADDLVQDTLVRALRAEHLFHGGDLRTWLFTILINLDRNRRRGLARRPVLAVIEELEPPGPPGSDGSSHDIARGLALLPAEQREVLLLAAVEELRYEEIARVLAIPIGTVMSRLSRARDKLKRMAAEPPTPLKIVR